MEFKENKAIYLQIADRICDEILTEKYRDEERIPSVREYSAEVEVNVNTVMRAYDYLQQQDVIFTKRGLGYYGAHGARTVIETIRRKEFFDVALSDLVRSMDTLGISIDEVVEKLHEMKKTLSTK